MTNSTRTGKHPHPIESVASSTWRGRDTDEHASLGQVFRSINVPIDAGFWRKMLAFIGPGYLIAVGYMDPGNWATDISGGSAFNYRLLSMVLMSNFLAMFVQALSAKLGIATGRDLAQACRDTYSKPVYWMLWITAEIGIVACEIAEVLGAAIALQLLFHIPLLIGVVLTVLDIILILALQQKGFRWIEAIVIGLIAIMTGVFALEIALAHPSWLSIAIGFVPHTDLVTNPKMLYLGLGILGATVMPHNLYLHSSIVQTRSFGRSTPEKKEAVKLAYIDSTVALTIALFINAAILIVAAAAFYRSGHHDVARIEDAYKLLSPLLGVTFAAPLFAIALLASGQNATLTGTLASQIILEGFIKIKLAPWILRLISRALAIIPCIIAIGLYGSKGTGQLLVLSQVVLSAVLPFAVIPLIQITSDRAKMGELVNGRFTRYIGWSAAALIAGLNIYLIATSV